MLFRSLDLVVATCTAALAGAMSVAPPDPRRVAGVVPSASSPYTDVLSARVSHVGIKGATCDLSELALRSQRRRVVSGGDNSVPPQDAQRQLRPRQVDGGTPRHLPSAPVHSAGSQLLLEGTERYQMAQMTKIKIV